VSDCRRRTATPAAAEYRTRCFKERSSVPTIAGVFLICFILCLGPAPLSARERSAPSSGTEGLEDIIEGFDEDAPAMTSGKDEEEKRQSFWDLTGDVTLRSSYNVHEHTDPANLTDWHGLSRLRLALDLELDMKFSQSWDAQVNGRGFYDFAYTINGRDKYTDEVLSAYESEVEFRDTYIRGSLLPSLDIKAGRQIVIWGKSDNIRVTDVLNPIDLRTPGLVDIEYLRLPVTMTRLDYYFGKWNVTGIAIHEIRFNKNPAFGSDFYPSPFPAPPEEIPSSGGANTEYAAALNGILPGWDISFYGAYFFDDNAHAVGFPVLPPPALVHSRITMAGTAVNVALGNWLLKSEGAYFTGLEYYTLPGEKKSRYDLLMGTEYAGFAEATISLEFVNRHVVDYDERLGISAFDTTIQDDFQSALRYQQDFRNDTLHLTLLALTYGWKAQNGAIQRFQLAYDVNDSLSVTGGYVNYAAGESGPFQQYGKNDRVFFDVKYSF